MVWWNRTSIFISEIYKLHSESSVNFMNSLSMDIYQQNRCLNQKKSLHKCKKNIIRICSFVGFLFLECRRGHRWNGRRCVPGGKRPKSEWFIIHYNVYLLFILLYMTYGIYSWFPIHFHEFEQFPLPTSISMTSFDKNDEVMSRANIWKYLFKDMCSWRIGSPLNDTSGYKTVIIGFLRYVV